MLSVKELMLFKVLDELAYNPGLNEELGRIVRQFKRGMITAYEGYGLVLDEITKHMFKESIEKTWAGFGKSEADSHAVMYRTADEAAFNFAMRNFVKNVSGPTATEDF